MKTVIRLGYFGELFGCRRLGGSGVETTRVILASGLGRFDGRLGQH